MTLRKCIEHSLTYNIVFPNSATIIPIKSNVRVKLEHTFQLLLSKVIKFHRAKPTVELQYQSISNKTDMYLQIIAMYNHKNFVH